MRTAHQDAAFLLGSQVVGTACLFVLGVIVARSLGAGGKGYYDLVLSTAQLLSTVLGLSLSSGTLFHSARGEVDARRFGAAAPVWALGLGGLAAAVLALGGASPLLSWLLPDRGGTGAALAVGATLGALQVHQLMHALAAGSGAFRASALGEAAARVAGVAAAGALAYTSAAEPLALVSAFACATALSALLAGAGAAAAAPRAPRPLPLRAIALYSAPLYLGNVVQFLNYRLDVYFVHGVVGLPAVGAYTVAVGLAQLLWLLPNAVSAPVLRAAAQPHSGPDLAAFVAQVNRMCLWTCALGGAALCAMAGPMLALVFGAEFAASRTPLLVLVPGVVLFAPTVVLSAYLGGVRRQVWTTWVACAAVVVTVVGNVLLVPRIGTAGAALASTASYTASSAATLFLVVRHGRGFTLGALLLPRAADVRAAARLLRGAR